MADEVESLETLSVLDKKVEVVIEPTFKIGDKAIHSDFYLRMLRGNYRQVLANNVYEVIGVTIVSVTVKPLGSPQKYGSQFPHRYLKKVD